MRDEFTGQKISFTDGILVHFQRVLRWIESNTRPSYWAKWNPWTPHFCEECGHHLDDHKELCERITKKVWDKYCSLCGRLKRNHLGIYH